MPVQVCWVWGITALIAGFMSGMAGNVSAFSAVLGYDIYRPLLGPSATDAEMLSIGRWSTVLGVILSIGTAYFAMRFSSIMEYVQVLFSFFVTPLFGTVILGMLWKRTTNAGAFWGLLTGTVSSIGMFMWVQLQPGALRYLAISSYAQPMAEFLYRRGSGVSFLEVFVVGFAFICRKHHVSSGGV